MIQQLGGLYALKDLKDPDPDLLLMRNSTVATVHLGADLNSLDNLDLRLRYKWTINRQHKDSFVDGVMQDASTLNRLTLSHRVEYRYPLNNRITLKARGRHLYWRDAGYKTDLQQQWSTYGLLFEEEFKLTERTLFVFGQEGIPGLVPIRHTEHNDQARDFKRWTDVFMLRTKSAYLGWDMVTEIGFEYEKKETAAAAFANRTFFIEMFFGF